MSDKTLINDGHSLLNRTPQFAATNKKLKSNKFIVQIFSLNRTLGHVGLCTLRLLWCVSLPVFSCLVLRQKGISLKQVPQIASCKHIPQQLAPTLRENQPCKLVMCQCWKCITSSRFLAFSDQDKFIQHRAAVWSVPSYCMDIFAALDLEELDNDHQKTWQMFLQLQHLLSSKRPDKYHTPGSS